MGICCLVESVQSKYSASLRKAHHAKQLKIR